MPPEAPPPPLPLRSPLREKPTCQQKGSQSLHTNITALRDPLPSPDADDMLEEIDRMLRDTHQSIIDSGNSFICESLSESPSDREVHSQERRRNHMRANEVCPAMEFLVSDSESDTPSIATCSTELLSPKRITRTQREIDESLETTMTLSHDCGHRVLTQEEVEDEAENRVQAWLTRGSSSPASQAAEHSQYFGTHRNRSYNSRQPFLSLFPPPSPVTGKREYVSPPNPSKQVLSPKSPLKNGRDTYSNYIASNRNDYFAIRSSSASPALDPLLEDPSEHSQHHSMQLRGGWGISNPFRTRSSTAERDMERSPVSNERKYARITKEQISVPINQASYERLTADRVAHNSHSQFLTTSRRRINRPQLPHNSGPQGTSPYGFAADELQDRSGPNRMPAGQGMRSPPNQDTAYGREVVQTLGDPSFPPVDEVKAPARTMSALRPHGYPVYGTTARQAAMDDESRSPDQQAVARDARRDRISDESSKRFDKALPRDRFKRVSPPLWEPAALLDISQGSSGDDELNFSTRTTNDDLRGLKGLHDSGPYMKIAQARAAGRIEENRECKRLEVSAERRYPHEERRRDPDVSKILLEDSESPVGQYRQRQPPARLEIQSVNEQDDYHAFPFPKDPPQHHNDGQARQTRLPQSSSTPAIRSSVNENTNSRQMALRIAEKVSRFLLSTPSDPSVKTCSKQYPPTDDGQRRVLRRTLPRNDGQDDAVRPVGVSLDRPSNTTSPVKGKGKGKGKEDLRGTTSERREFAPKGLHQSDSAETTVRNSNLASSQTVFKPPNPRFQFDTMSASDADTTLTQWPEEDSTHNLVVPRRSVGLRGGEGDGPMQSDLSAASSVNDEAVQKGKWKDKMKAKWGNGESFVGTHALTMQTMM